MQIIKGVSFTGLQLFAAEYGSGSQLRENFISHRPMIYFFLSIRTVRSTLRRTLIFCCIAQKIYQSFFIIQYYM